MGNHPFSPTQSVKSPRVPAGRVRYLQPTELRLLLAACPEWLRPIVGLGAATGMRRSEILKLRWLDVDLTNARIMLPQTKNGDARIVYLNQSALAALRSVLRSSNRSASALFLRRLSPTESAWHLPASAVGRECLISAFMICATRRRVGCGCKGRTFTR